MTQSRLLLVRLRPNIERLTQWAIKKNYLPNRHSTDLGYALHAALKASLGDTAPKPFVLRNETRNGHSSHEILGYVHANPEMDMARLSSPITPETEMLRVSSMEIREMPNTWPLGTRLAFEVRIRPVVRARRSGRFGATHEVDAAVWATEQAARQQGQTPPGREDVYAMWLKTRIENHGVDLLASEVIGIRRTRVRRRPMIGTERQARDSEGPDVLMRGKIRITNGEKFTQSLTGGIGRHKGFGFGCMLLAPPGSWD